MVISVARLQNDKKADKMPHFLAERPTLSKGAIVSRQLTTKRALAYLQLTQLSQFEPQKGEKE